MKTSKIIIVIVIIIGIVLGVVAWNAFRIKHKFVVLYNTSMDFCFLVDDRYKLALFTDHFEYTGGKNKGIITIENQKLSENILKVNINGFMGGYRKLKNKRIYEYQLFDQYKLVDVFENASKMPVNLVPYRKNCKKIMTNFKNHIEIFKGVDKK